MTEPGSDMTMRAEREHQAQDAINQFVQHSCAFLVPGEKNRVATEVGTGAIVRTGAGHCCILTVKHVAEDARDKQYRLGFLGCSNPIPDFVWGILLYPGDVDVALLIVKDQFAPVLASRALTQNSIPLKNEEGIAHEDSLVLVGYPARMSLYNEAESQQGFVSITYWCPPADISPDRNGRYQVEWKDAILWRNEKTFELPEPKGMSGAPLWRFRKGDLSSVWLADRIGKIVAIQSAWDKKEILFLEPVDKWGTWFHERFANMTTELGKMQAPTNR